MKVYPSLHLACLWEQDGHRLQVPLGAGWPKLVGCKPKWLPDNPASDVMLSARTQHTLWSPDKWQPPHGRLETIIGGGGVQTPGKSERKKKRAFLSLLLIYCSTYRIKAEKFELELISHFSYWLTSPSRLNQCAIFLPVPQFQEGKGANSRGKIQ